MISEAEARQVAEKALAQRGGGLVIVRTVEHDIGWEYAWQSLEYVETGDEMVMVIGTAPILVSRTDGSLIQQAFTVRSSSISTTTSTVKRGGRPRPSSICS